MVLLVLSFSYTIPALAFVINECNMLFIKTKIFLMFECVCFCVKFAFRKSKLVISVISNMK